MTRNVLAVAALLTLMPAAASAQKAARAVAPTTPASRDPLTMDVVGIRLNMPADAALSTLRARGYACDKPAAELTFAQEVQQVLARRAGKSSFPPEGETIREVTCTGPVGEDLLVRFAQVPTGTVVNWIQLRLPAGRVDLAAFRAELPARYGRPTEGTTLDGQWCGRSCKAPALLQGPAYLVVRALPPGDGQIMASRGDAARQRDKAAVQAEADRLSPPRKAAF